MGFSFRDETAQRKAQSVRDLLGNVQPHTHLAKFNRTDVGTVDAGLVRERFLGEPKLLAAPANGLPERFADSFRHGHKILRRRWNVYR